MAAVRSRRLSVRTVLGGTVAATAAYLAAATILAGWFDRQPLNTVTWSDCLLAPVRWDKIQRKRGEAELQAGRAALASGRIQEGVRRLEAGLIQAPDAADARQALAEGLLASGRRERALRVLLDGLGPSYPGRNYVEALVAVALEGEDFELADEALQRARMMTDPAARADGSWLAAQHAQVYLLDGRPADALAALSAAGTSPTARALEVRSLVDLQRLDDAVAALRIWRDAAAESEELFRLEMRVARERGDIAGMRDAWQGLRQLSPAQPDGWAFAVVQERLAGQEAAAIRLLDDCLFRFGATSAQLRVVAEPLVELGDRQLLEQVLVTAREQDLLDWGLLALDVRLALREGDGPRAEQTLLHMKQQHRAELPAAQAAWYDLAAATAVALQNPQERAQLDLVRHCARLRLPLRTWRSLLADLQHGGLQATAWQVAEIALRHYPRSETLLAARDELVRQGWNERVPPPPPGPSDDEWAVAVVPAASPPSEALAPAALTLLAPDALRGPASFAAVWNRLAEEGHWEELKLLMAELREEAPQWLAGYDSALHDREVELLAQLGDVAALATAVRQRLDGSNTRGLEAMRLVLHYDEQGQRDVAEVILSEVLARQPKFPAAVRQRRSWDEARGGGAAPGAE